MKGINADWHRVHPMTKNPTLDQRITWHIGHARACGCREIPAKLGAEMKKRGIDLSAVTKNPTAHADDLA
jgi:hypothetical protein